MINPHYLEIEKFNPENIAVESIDVKVAITIAVLLLVVSFAPMSVGYFMYKEAPISPPTQGCTQ